MRTILYAAARLCIRAMRYASPVERDMLLILARLHRAEARRIVIH